jgi:exonuclease V gamma subunit
VSVFGVSLLSPFLVRVLQAMARHTRVTLHMLTPTQAFVAERSTRRQLLWRAAESGTSASDMAEALHMQAGHPLLDAMGQQASQAERVLLDLDADLQDTAGEPRVAASMLERLQRDMLLDQPPELGSAQADGSVQVHSVTTPLRAAEVAHDAVLAAMSDMPGLRPERVAILTPDIRGVGRFLESVFEQRGVIPLTASDRQLARSSSLAEAMHHAMAAVTDGLTMAGVRATLGQAGVLERLRLGADGLVRWLDRLEQAGARRFLDPRDRAARLERPQTPDDRIHTLQWAVDRVVLGLAMASAPDPLALVASPAASVDPELLPSPASGSAGLEELHQVVQAIEAVAGCSNWPSGCCLRPITRPSAWSEDSSTRGLSGWPRRRCRADFWNRSTSAWPANSSRTPWRTRARARISPPGASRWRGFRPCEACPSTCWCWSGWIWARSLEVAMPTAST